MLPFEEGKLAQRFHVLQLFMTFSGPISPIYSFLRCFYQAHKPEPKNVTKNYEKLQTSYEKLRKVTNKLRDSYEQLQKAMKIKKNELRNNFL